MDGTDTSIFYFNGFERRGVELDPLSSCGIGRSLSNAIVLDDPHVSREHAEIRRDAAGRCFLVDVGARNKTRLNGQLVIGKTPLKNGDVVTISEASIEIVQLKEPLERGDAGSIVVASQDRALATVLAANIRNFAYIVQVLGAEKAEAFGAEFESVSAKIFIDNGCWSNKSVGDAVMATWVHANQQIRRSEMLRILDAISELQYLCKSLQRQFNVMTPLRISCGVTSAVAELGDRAGDGETVRLAFGLEGATKAQDCDILIGESVFHSLTPLFPQQDIPNIRGVAVEGYNDPQAAAGLAFSDLSSLSRYFIEDKKNFV